MPPARFALESLVVAHHVAQLLIGGHAAAGHAAAGHAVAAHLSHAAADQVVTAHLAAAHAAAGHAVAVHATAAHNTVIQILGTKVATGTIGGIVLANFLNNLLNDLYKQVSNGVRPKLTKPELGAFINAASSDVRADFRRRGTQLDQQSQLEITGMTRDMIEAFTA